MVFPTFFNLTLKFAIRISWSKPQSAPGFFFVVVVDFIELLHLQLQRIESIWFWYWLSGDVHMKRRLLCCWKRVCAIASVFSWQNSVRAKLCPTSFCTPRPNLLVTPGISWFPTFAFQYPMRKRTSLLVLVLEGLVGPQNHSTSVSSNEWLGNRLGLLWYSMVCLVDEQRSFCHFLDYTQVLHFGFFVDYEDSISSKEFLPTVVDIRVIWIKFTHSNAF